MAALVEEQPVPAYDARRPAPVPVPAPRRPGLLRAAAGVLPGVARLGAETAVHTTVWGVTGYARGVGRIAKAVIDPDAAAKLSDDLSVATGALAEVLRAVGGDGPLSQAVQRVGLPVLDRARVALESQGARARETEEERLRRSGEELLQRSRDVWRDDSRHPAYDSILRDLAPDEARMLVLLLKDGPQPSVDVRTGGAMGRFQQSRVVARGLTMIGSSRGG